MQKVPVGALHLEEYNGLAPNALLGDVTKAAKRVKRTHVIHVNATPVGGGVAEILRSLVPLMRSVGVDAEWYAIEPNAPFFRVTKALHHNLQGQRDRLRREEIRLFLHHNEREAEALATAGVTADLWIIHDPQVLPLLHYLKTTAPAVWISHIDTTDPNDVVRDVLLPYMKEYQRTVFSLPQYRLKGLNPDEVSVFPPAIDALIPKNQPLPHSRARQVLAGLGIDPARPLVSQVSRFDRWKDPWGVIDAYRLARKEVPGLQLALVGAMSAKDDADGLEVLASVQEHAGSDPDIHLYPSPVVIGNLEVNAFQSGSEVIVQKSIREGFGLTVAEAMWKGSPVVGGDCGGIRLQIRDGRTGFLVAGVPTCAQRIVTLLKDQSLARRMGAAGRESVRRNYLMPRLLRDYLHLAASLLDKRGRP